MYRVALAALVALALAGCGMSSRSIDAGLVDGERPATTAGIQRKSATASLGGEPANRTDSGARTAAGGPATTGSVANQRTASLDAKPADRAPSGSFEKAPKGALADRDYSTAQLDAERALGLINAYRREKGLKPLKLNVELTNAAKAHSRDLAKWDRISHYGSDGSNPWDRVKRTGYNAKLAAENVGTGQATIDEVMKGWKESPGHNKNLLLADAEHMGIALIQDGKTEFKTFWTLVLGSSL